MIVLTTLIVFATGVALLFVGLNGRGALLLVHKVSFIVWVAFTALHVLGHLPRAFAWLRTVSAGDPRVAGIQPGVAGRWIAVVGAVVGGIVLAIALLPQFSAWTGHFALLRHQPRYVPSVEATSAGVPSRHRRPGRSRGPGPGGHCPAGQRAARRCGRSAARFRTAVVAQGDSPAASLKALHDETGEFAHQTRAARATALEAGSFDGNSFAIAFKGVLLEGLEVAFIGITFGANQHRVGLAAVAAGVAVGIVALAGFAVRARLARCPRTP